MYSRLRDAAQPPDDGHRYWPPLGGNPEGARSIEYGDIIHDQDNSGSASRKIISLFIAAAAIAATLAAVQPAAAQRAGGLFGEGSASTSVLAPGMRLHAVNPSLSLSTSATSPLQQQMQDDYATSLMGAQRQLLQENPSGSSRSELSIGSQLNGYMGPR